MIIYILKHSDSDFSGTVCGVGFSNGRGSTSSKFDKDRCVKAGCKDISGKVKSIQAAQKKKEEAKAAKAEKAKEKAKKKDEKPAEKDAEKKEDTEPKKEEEKAEEPEKEKK